MVPSGLVLDVVDDSGRAIGDRVRSDLEAGGITVGAVTSGTTDVPSGIDYPAAEQAHAQQFAGAIDATSYLKEAQVAHLTVVLGPGGDADALLAALDKFTACRSPAPSPATTTEN